MQQVNPHTASSQNFRFTFDKEVEFACTPGSLPKGTIAITKTGVAIYNPLTSADLNAVEGDDAEKFDRCNGHSDSNGVYHYHQSPESYNCGDTYTAEYDQFIGVALDGFPIYGPRASDKGTEPLTSDDLDICHGRMVDGKYRYHLTSDFPYVLGCFWGAGARDNSQRVSYTCDKSVGTDLTEYGYLCSNVDQRNVDSTVCSSYPGTVDVTTDDDDDVATAAPTTAAPTEATTEATTQASRTRRPRKGGLRSKENKPNPAREAYLKQWLKRLLEETK
ncbi:uncharacterized protein LOC133190614 [Saccostrea echinata]|uniref:uncharacterized protein LOC133190614 n=1 Tax=Saccostrea echinata TaxID=191078 RepID=UPI002A7EEABD|nr:uncharacterized protein LOC133190614 [Saccostrea echinata]